VPCVKKVHNHILKGLPLDFIGCHINSVHDLACFRPILISSFLSWSGPSCYFLLSFSDRNSVYISHCFHLFFKSCPPYPPLSDHPNDILERVVIKNLLIDIPQYFHYYLKYSLHAVMLLHHVAYIFFSTLWPQSTSELYRPSDRRLSAKLVPTFLRLEGAMWSA
jgi:hypothetical protein